MEITNEDKQDVVDDIFAKQNKRARVRKEGAFIGVLIVLIAIVFFQSIELGRLRGFVVAAEKSGVAPAAQQTAPAAAPRANSGLPSQVGGC